MVARLAGAPYPPSEPVARAMRAVPRHRFVPGVPIEDAYADRTVVIKPGPAGGRPVSCASTPGIVALMLDQLEVTPGARVLEIGAGTGYNAALLAELVGPTGSVTTVDIDPQVAAHARAALDATGYRRIRVRTGDGAAGDPDGAPFDRIIVTVGPWDLPPAWRAQLGPDGRLVVPLSWRGQSRSVAFRPDGPLLRSTSGLACGFIPMLGPGQDGTRDAELAPGVQLCWDADQAVEPALLRGVLDTPAERVWTGIVLGPREPFDELWPLLSALERGVCRITAEPAAVSSGRCSPAQPGRGPALVERGSLAYPCLRPVDPVAVSGTARRWEVGATGHGRDGSVLAGRLARHLRDWDRDRLAGPDVTACPAATPDADLPAGMVIDKPGTRLVLTPPPIP